MSQEKVEYYVNELVKAVDVEATNVVVKNETVKTTVKSINRQQILALASIACQEMEIKRSGTKVTIIITILDS